MAAIKNDDADSARNQIVEASHDAGRICDRKFGRLLANRRDMPFIHATTITALAS